MRAAVGAALLFALLVEFVAAGCAAEVPSSGRRPAVSGQGPARRSSRPVKGSVLPLQRAAQRTSSWCWAATTEMALIDLLGDAAPPVCGKGGIIYATWEQANGKSWADNCLAACDSCGDPSDAALEDCINSGWPQLAPYGITYSITPVAQQKQAAAALPWDELKAQLTPGARRKASPVLFAWSWTGGGGHVALVSGYLEDARAGQDGRLVLIQDPWPPCIGDTYFMPHAGWVGAPAVGRVHWLDYWNLKAPPAAQAAMPVEGEPSAAPAASVAWANPDLAPATTTPAMIPLHPVLRPLDADGTGPPGVQPAALARAREGLRLLQRVVTDERTCVQLGFPSQSELRRARIGPPIWEARVRLDDLRNFDPVALLDGLLTADGWIFPVVAGRGGAVFSSVCVEHDGERWVLAELGGHGWLERIVAGRHAGARENPSWPADEMFLVSVPALRDYFIGHHDAQGLLWLIALPGSPGQLTAPARPARDFVMDLIQESKEHDGERPG